MLIVAALLIGLLVAAAAAVLALRLHLVQILAVARHPAVEQALAHPAQGEERAEIDDRRHEGAHGRGFYRVLR